MTKDIAYFMGICQYVIKYTMCFDYKYENASALATMILFQTVSWVDNILQALKNVSRQSPCH